MRGKMARTIIFTVLLTLFAAGSLFAQTGFDAWVVADPTWVWSYDRDSSFAVELWVHTYQAAAGGSLGIVVNRLLVRMDSCRLGPSTSIALKQQVAVTDSFFASTGETLTYALMGGINFDASPIVPNGQDVLFGTAYMTLKADSLSSIEAFTIDFFMDSSKIPPAGDFVLSDAVGASLFPNSWETDTIDMSFSKITDINPGVIPEKFELGQNYPNPFNPTTNIEFAVPVRSHVKLSVYNVMGQKVRTLVDEELDAGWKLVVWDGKSGSGTEVGSGVYLYRVEAGDFIESKKMSLVK